MRKKLVKLDKDDRRFYTATFSGYRISGGSRGVTQRPMFIDVRDEDGTYITKFTIFEDMGAFSKLNLEEGDIVLFKARIVDYEEEYPDYYNRYGYIHTPKFPRFIYPTKTAKLYSPAKRLRLEDSIKKESTVRIKINAK